MGVYLNRRASHGRVPRKCASHRRKSHGHASHGCVPYERASHACLMGVYLTGVHLMGVHLTGVHLIGVYLMSIYLISVNLISVYQHRHASAYGRAHCTAENFNCHLRSGPHPKHTEGCPSGRRHAPFREKDRGFRMKRRLKANNVTPPGKHHSLSGRNINHSLASSPPNPPKHSNPHRSRRFHLPNHALRLRPNNLPLRLHRPRRGP